MKQRVLFVGHSDTRITPLCSAIMKYLCINKEVEDLEFSSSGFWAMEGQAVHPTLLTAAGEIGIDLSEYKAHYITIEDIEWATLIIPQDAMVARGVAAAMEHSKNKLTRPLMVFQPDSASIFKFRKCRDECLVYCEKLLKKLSVSGKDRVQLSSDMEYRTILKEEAPQVLALEQACFSHPWTLANIESEIEKDTGFFVGAFHEGEMVGYASLYYVEGSAFMNNVGVHPDFRQLGIGETLMKELEKLSLEKGIYTISLEVRSKNNPAISMYEKLGYKKAGTRKFFYRDPVDDGDIMTKIIRELPKDAGVYRF